VKRSVLYLLGGLLVIGGLVGLELVSLGILGGDDGGGAGGDADLIGVEAPDATKGATLKGTGDGTPRGADADVAVVDPFDSVPAEVHGSTPNGGAIRGRVIRKDGGVPLAGVRVTLGRPDSILTYLRAKANGRFDELEARTGSDGRFAFLDVTRSKGYVVRARHEGYAIASSEDDLDLTARDGIDLGDLALGQGGTLTGRVVGPEGTPLPNVRIVIAWRISNPIGIILADPDTVPEIEREVRTGPDGRFKAERLDPTPKTIIAVAPSGASQVVRSVSLEDGALKAIDDIRMPGQGVIAGTVVWADGKPIAGARVFAAPRMQAAVRTVETDAEGAFRLAWLPEGENYVIGTLVEGLPVDLTMGVSLGEENARIEFPLAGSLKGVVVAAEGGAPLGRFAVQVDDAEPPEDFQMRFVMEQVKRGVGPTPFEAQDGSFTFPRVAAGTYHLTISAAGYPDVVKEGVVVVAGEAAEVRIEVPRGHIGKGIVRKASGDPLAGARLYVVQGVPSSASGVNLSGYLYGREPDVVARGDGSFELPPQTPGVYSLIAAHPTALPGILRSVDLEAGDASDLEVRMPPSGTIRGRLLDESARPAKNEQVYVVYRDGVVRTARTGEDGRFELAGMPVGRLVCRWLSLLDVKTYATFMRPGSDDEARSSAFDALREEHGEHDLQDGAVIEIALNIPRRVEVSGHYRMGGEPPPAKVRNFFVTVFGGAKWIEVTLEEEGAFETRLLPGKYLAYGPGASGEWTSTEIEILEGPTFRLLIDMK